MAVINNEIRRRMWSEALAERDAEVRRGRVAQLAVYELGRLARHLDLYHDHDEDFQATFLLLDAEGLLDELVEPWSITLDRDSAQDPAAEDFLALMTARLARVSRSNSEHEAEAHRLFRFWRRHLYDRHDRDESTLTVAETAALFGISPQAVYKWIRRGSVEVIPGSPDGKTRIAASSLRLSREQQRAIDALRHDLYGDQSIPNKLPLETIEALARRSERS